MGKFKDLTGQKIGKLTVEKKIEGSKPTKWLCKCDCGNYKEIFGSNLTRNHTTSCGCLAIKKRSERMKKNNPGKIHNLYHTRLHTIWTAMKQRCYSTSHIHYKNYGGRGITICEEWLDKENGMLNFYNWAMANGYKENLTIDRIDVNGNYKPNNCRWITMQEQQNNKRNNYIIKYNNKEYTMTNLARKYNINPDRLSERLRNGWDLEKALKTPIRKRGESN